MTKAEGEGPQPPVGRTFITRSTKRLRSPQPLVGLCLRQMKGTGLSRAPSPAGGSPGVSGQRISAGSGAPAATHGEVCVWRGGVPAAPFWGSPSPPVHFPIAHRSASWDPLQQLPPPLHSPPSRALQSPAPLRSSHNKQRLRGGIRLCFAERPPSSSWRGAANGWGTSPSVPPITNTRSGMGPPGRPLPIQMCTPLIQLCSSSCWGTAPTRAPAAISAFTTGAAASPPARGSEERQIGAVPWAATEKEDIPLDRKTVRAEDWNAWFSLRAARGGSVLLQNLRGEKRVGLKGGGGRQCPPAITAWPGLGGAGGEPWSSSWCHPVPLQEGDVRSRQWSRSRCGGRFGAHSRSNT